LRIWRQQPSTPAYCCDYTAEEMRKAFDMAVEGEAEKIRDNWKEVFRQLPVNPTHDDLVALNRRVNVSSLMICSMEHPVCEGEFRLCAAVNALPFPWETMQTLGRLLRASGPPAHDRRGRPHPR
jgi:hypothetical protein